MIYEMSLSVFAGGGKGDNKEEVECCVASLRPSRVSDGRHLVLLLVFARNVVILSGNIFVVTVEYETKYRSSGHKCNTKSNTEVYRVCPSPEIGVIVAGAYAATRSCLPIFLVGEKECHCFTWLWPSKVVLMLFVVTLCFLICLSCICRAEETIENAIFSSSLPNRHCCPNKHQTFRLLEANHASPQSSPCVCRRQHT